MTPIFKLKKKAMILEQHNRELAQIRAHFISAIMDKCNEPTVQLDDETNPMIFDGPIKIGTVKLETEKSEVGITFRYVLEKPKEEVEKTDIKTFGYALDKFKFEVPNERGSQAGAEL
jgi:hypothetical protein